MKKIIPWLAYNSFIIIKLSFYSYVLFCSIYQFYFPITDILIIFFGIVSGMFAGYKIAYYSIKYLHKKNRMVGKVM